MSPDDDTVVYAMVFCHYPTVFGFFLGLVQYLPIILLFGSFFWALRRKDLFFINIVFTLKVTWVLGILLKYILIYSGAVYQSPIDSIAINETARLVSCENYAPSFFDPFVQYISVYMADSSSINVTKLAQGNMHAFPHIDIMQSSVYLSYTIGFYIVWLYPIELPYLLGIALICIVPWSFIAARSASFLNAAISTITGLGIGAISLWLGYRNYLKNKTTHSKQLEDAGTLGFMYKFLGINKYYSSPMYDYTPSRAEWKDEPTGQNFRPGYF